MTSSKYECQRCGKKKAGGGHRFCYACLVAILEETLTQPVQPQEEVMRFDLLFYTANHPFYHRRWTVAYQAKATPLDKALTPFTVLPGIEVEEIGLATPCTDDSRWFSTSFLIVDIGDIGTPCILQVDCLKETQP